MAFGKDRGKVSGMNLRQQMRRGAKRAPKGGRGGGAPFFVNRYQPPDAGSSDIIRVIPGEYDTPRVDLNAKDFERDENGAPIIDKLPFLKWIEYFNGKNNRSCVGSEGPLGEFKGKGEPCLAADWFWWEWRQRQKNKAAGGDGKHPNAMSRRDKFAFTVLVQAPFYRVPQTDRETGQVRMNENTKEPYYEWLQGAKRGTDEYAAAGYERKEGHLQHWSLGSGHWNTLSEYADSLAAHCRACGGRDCIEEVALICQECGDAVVDFSTTTLSDEDLQKVRDEEVLCPHCSYTGYLENVIRCNKCNSGEQATLFDFDLEVKRVKTSNNDGGQQTNLVILSARGPRPIDGMYGDDLRKALPLDKIFRPTPIEKQRELFGDVPDDDAPQQQSGQRNPSNRGSRSYGG